MKLIKKLSRIHNYLGVFAEPPPLPEDKPDRLPSLSSNDEDERPIRRRKRDKNCPVRKMLSKVISIL